MTPDALPAGLVAVVGDEGSGKTRLLQAWQAQRPSEVAWVDLTLPGRDPSTPREIWAEWRANWPSWNERLHDELIDALDLGPHVDKACFMLSRGSRRKVAVLALLASGARVTCLDQPYAALDAASVRVLRDFLSDMAEHPGRTWVVADYEADPGLPWAHTIRLGG